MEGVRCQTSKHVKCSFLKLLWKCERVFKVRCEDLFVNLYFKAELSNQMIGLRGILYLLYTVRNATHTRLRFQN
jgi:hypothetical protein